MHSDSDSLFTKFYNKESVSKAVSIQAYTNNNTDIHQLATHLYPANNLTSSLFTGLGQQSHNAAGTLDVAGHWGVGTGSVAVMLLKIAQVVQQH